MHAQILSSLGILTYAPAQSSIGMVGTLTFQVLGIKDIWQEKYQVSPILAWYLQYLMLNTQYPELSIMYYLCK